MLKVFWHDVTIKRVSPMARNLKEVKFYIRFFFQKENVNLNLPVDVLPSRQFVASLKRNYERDKLARLLSEMEVLFEISAEVPRTLTDNDWQLYFNLQDVNERERFLARIYAEQLNAVRIAQQRAESAVIRQKVKR